MRGSSHHGNHTVDTRSSIWSQTGTAPRYPTSSNVVVERCPRPVHSKQRTQGARRSCEATQLCRPRQCDGRTTMAQQIKPHSKINLRSKIKPRSLRNEEPDVNQEDNIQHAQWFHREILAQRESRRQARRQHTTCSPSLSHG